MDYIKLTDSQTAMAGIIKMLEACECYRDGTEYLVDIDYALLIVEIMKLAEDRDEWFLHGKWATIQNIQSKIDKQLATVWQGSIRPNGE